MGAWVRVVDGFDMVAFNSREQEHEKQSSGEIELFVHVQRD